MTSHFILLLVSLLAFATFEEVVSFQSFKLPNFSFLSSPSSKTGGKQQFPLEQKKLDLLDAISSTNNGKDATVQEQMRVLKMVREIELAQPPSDTLLTNVEEAKELLDGVWYLQYTSPSEIDNDDDTADTDIDGDSNNMKEEEVWKMENAEEYITTKKAKMKGGVNAQGFKVDTSNRPVKQIFDIDNMIVSNEVQADFGFVSVGGPFRPSDNVSNRSIVSFTAGKIQLNLGITINLSWIFFILAQLKGTADNGWLETTYVGQDLRIGRGNKGNMFILTRDPNAVQP
mmetsp:Transcript_4833/g.4556  ORF Transcript_4833/g.4556 Transcript_4833/m.4556 type:complete len:286 (-) Transcript_4833:58-915(-)|eukprot:CAMPEP_0197831656 /NCGR_PEP_ID=MMETSP1437-20131217/11417_1 /TAXON_ID=49252 ORGANISM="Eucampia antarctica, Strain CCMP1452" /NCGR_SAMPLE_ID=MMETSP1437 /ASSEMBLY_ACC=CAM_ASM_001096 /LENGTH=285 /DNA_ID=CAMNT_0043434669 /DNA_START=37 /DNA_END=897 /DNA_ORIENTATION=+